MEMFPFFRGPYYYAHNRYMREPYNVQKREEVKNQRQDYLENRRIKQNEEKKETIGHTGINKRIETNGEKPIFEIFGIKLYFDDILLIALIFFLYNEGVEDNLLFVSLILLLLT